MSPARDPKALEPPEPPRAPTNPPPLPRWISTSPMSRTLRISTITFNRPGNQVHGCQAAKSMLDTSCPLYALEGRRRSLSYSMKRHYRERLSPGKAGFIARRRFRRDDTTPLPHFNRPTAGANGTRRRIGRNPDGVGLCTMKGSPIRCGCRYIEQEPTDERDDPD